MDSIPAEQGELVRTLPAAEAARRTERTLQAIYARRSRLQVPGGRQRMVIAQPKVSGDGAGYATPPHALARVCSAIPQEFIHEFDP